MQRKILKMANIVLGFLNLLYNVPSKSCGNSVDEESDERPEWDWIKKK